jgi:hypothetical protein
MPYNGSGKLIWRSSVRDLISNCTAAISTSTISERTLLLACDLAVYRLSTLLQPEIFFNYLNDGN